MIRNITSIFRRDVMTIIKNKAALVILVGVCIMPCLYTLVNVKAIWNPYSSAKLSNISIAVVNRDRGTIFQNRYINIGNEVVSNLKRNHDIGWKFVDPKEAYQGMMYGKYYAEIEIPEDFSSDLSSIITNTPRRARILYKTNTKNSPMGTKITESAVNSLVSSIKSNFIYSVNKAVFSSLNIIGGKADKGKFQIIDMKDSLIALGNNMDLVTAVLGSINDSSSSIALILTQLKPVIYASENVNITNPLTDDNEELIRSIKLSLNSSFDNIQVNLNNAKANIYGLQTLADNLDSLTQGADSSNIKSVADKMNYQIDMLNNEIDNVIDFSQAVNGFAHSSKISNFLNSLSDIKDWLSSEKNNINNLQKNLNNTDQISSDLKNSIVNNTWKARLKLINAIDKYNNEVRRELNSIADNLIVSSNNSADILETARNMNSQGIKSIDTLINGSRLVADSSGKLENKLLQFKNPIINLSNELKLINNNDIVKIITVLQNNPELMGNFMANPFNIKEENIYTIPNFGSAFAPTYMTISIWVGCTMLAAMLKTTAAKFIGSERLSLREEYLGKMLIFIAISIIQSLIIVFTSRFILHVYTKSFFLMIMFGLFSSLAFSTIVYGMVSIFGNLGKALAVLLVVIQMAGSGATYPVQLNPLILRIFQPMFPFTYSLSGFRESIGGPLISTVVMDFSMLILMSVIAVLVGLFLKRPLNGIMSRLHSKFTESGIGV